MRYLALAAVVVFMVGCGDEGPTDDRVGKDVDGSGQEQLLDDAIFRKAVSDIGVSPRTRPPLRLGREIGRRMRALTIDTGRMAPRSFAPGRYRQMLVRRGPLSVAEFRRRYGERPGEMCDRLGALVGQLDWRLDEGADPEPELARGVLEGYGRGDTTPQPANRITAVRDQLSGLLPDEGRAQCASRFRSSYVFVSALYRED